MTKLIVTKSSMGIIYPGLLTTKHNVFSLTSTTTLDLY